MARLMTLTQETSIREISDRIFGTLNARDRARAEKALLDANPHLAAADALARGTVVRVPGISGLKARSAVGAQEPLAELRDAVAAGATDYQATLSTHADAVAGQIDAQAELLKDRAVAAELKRVGATDLAKQLTDSLRERSKVIAENRKRHDGLFKGILGDLQRLFEG